ncbi:hypothetical protein K450DRAFT_297118 [Umbelopsis ramanniana AG]|uniref:Uncharacterized protein n=1 Tax=Umbelopsis ramanniana AG TaxID=1314678 RepID=A0AAD5HI52_UMBRA|nr:uncharacterized protein K450DRAFT_297118 [Umbelopsis ramanniana AG]KAI8583321.1 hypothetical protein K450DRAFT_297118 [Umbelopsis ramanniana AG]
MRYNARTMVANFNVQLQANFLQVSGVRQAFVEEYIPEDLDQVQADEAPDDGNEDENSDDEDFDFNSDDNCTDSDNESEPLGNATTGWSALDKRNIFLLTDSITTSPSYRCITPCSSHTRPPHKVPWKTEYGKASILLLSKLCYLSFLKCQNALRNSTRFVLFPEYKMTTKLTRRSFSIYDNRIFNRAMKKHYTSWTSINCRTKRSPKTSGTAEESDDEDEDHEQPSNIKAMWVISCRSKRLSIAMDRLEHIYYAERDNVENSLFDDGHVIDGRNNSADGRNNSASNSDDAIGQPPHIFELPEIVRDSVEGTREMSLQSAMATFKNTLLTPETHMPRMKKVSDPPRQLPVSPAEVTVVAWGNGKKGTATNAK